MLGIGKVFTAHVESHFSNTLEQLFSGATSLLLIPKTSYISILMYASGKCYGEAVCLRRLVRVFAARQYAIRTETLMS